MSTHEVDEDRPNPVRIYDYLLDGGVPDQQRPQDAEQRAAFGVVARAVLGELPRWQAAGLRAEAVLAIQFHADQLSDEHGRSGAHHLASRIDAYVLAELLSSHLDPEAGHLATDLLELLAV